MWNERRWFLLSGKRTLSFSHWIGYLEPSTIHFGSFAIEDVPT